MSSYVSLLPKGPSKWADRSQYQHLQVGIRSLTVAPTALPGAFPLFFLGNFTVIYHYSSVCLLTPLGNNKVLSLPEDL